MSQYDRLEKSRRKHEPSNSGASRAAPPPPKQRPEWKGPGFSAKKAGKSNTPRIPAQAAAPNIQPQLLPLELQQLVLNIFRTTFPISQGPDELKPILQNIKDALFRRDFDLAFGNEEQCEAYAVRWSPSRVLGYSNLLAWVVEECKDESWIKRLLCDSSGSRDDLAPLNVLCIGGGAAEVASFNSLVRHLQPKSRGKPAEELEQNMKQLGIQTAEDEEAILKIHLIDSAPWSSVISKLQSGLTSPPTLSKYASASARASNTSFIKPGATEVTFTQADILSFNKEQLENIIGEGPTMVTMFFTLNELYTTSMARTTKLLMELSLASKEGTLLCVIDSAGSYSEVAVRKPNDTLGSSPATSEQETTPNFTSENSSSTSSKPSPKTVTFAEDEASKKYPMHWLMDRTLLGKGGGKLALWEKLVVDESRWFRLDESLKYPISLENMRFQVHLFKRV